MIPSTSLQKQNQFPPYSSSGASSRRHYKFIRSLEDQPSKDNTNGPHQHSHLHTSDEQTIVWEELLDVKNRISAIKSTSDIRTELIRALHCFLLSSSGPHSAPDSKSIRISDPKWDSILHAAIQLAGSSQTLEEKRIGYLLCNEILPREHALRLLQINTIRLDLSSTRVSRISLALKALIAAPTPEVVPAVRDRIVDLLNHPSPEIKLLSLLSLSTLAPHDPSLSLLSDPLVSKRVLERVRNDGEERVVIGALRAGEGLVSVDLLASQVLLQTVYTRYLSQKAKSNVTRKGRVGSTLPRSSTILSATFASSSFRARLLESAVRLSLHKESDTKGVNSSNPKVVDLETLVDELLGLLNEAVERNRQSTILSLFRTLALVPRRVLYSCLLPPGPLLESNTPSARLFEKDTPEASLNPRPYPGPKSSTRSHLHPLSLIRHLLTSRSPNDTYLFLSCLECLNSSLWLGQVDTVTGETDANTSGSVGVGSSLEIRLTEESRTEVPTSTTTQLALPPVLDKWEVEKMMQGLESPDEGIRKKTLRLLCRVDSSIVTQYYSQLLKRISSLSSPTPNVSAGSTSNSKSDRLPSTQSPDTRSTPLLSPPLKPHGHAHTQVLSSIPASLALAPSPTLSHSSRRSADPDPASIPKAVGPFRRTVAKVTSRLLEVVDALHSSYTLPCDVSDTGTGFNTSDVVKSPRPGVGDAYGHKLVEIVRTLGGQNERQVGVRWKSVIVEHVVRICQETRSPTFISMLISCLSDSVSSNTVNEVSPTLLLVLLTIATEHARRISPKIRTIVCNALVHQLAIGATLDPDLYSLVLVCVLRLLSFDNSTSNSPTCKGVVKAVNSFKTRLGSLTNLDPGDHLAKRCDQFLVLVEDMGELMTVATVDDDISLPEFFALLDNLDSGRKQVLGSNKAVLGVSTRGSEVESKTQGSITGVGTMPPVSVPPPQGLSPRLHTKAQSSDSKLRYEAYMPTPPSPSRARTTMKTLSRQGSGSTSTGSFKSLESDGDDLAGKSMDRTLTAGDLTIMYGSRRHAVSASVRADDKTQTKGIVTPNLIAFEDTDLDSPFLSEPGLLDTTDPQCLPQYQGYSAAPEFSQDRVFTSLPNAESESLIPTHREAFSAVWSADDALVLSARGWLEVPVDEALRRLLEMESNVGDSSEAVGIQLEVLNELGSPFSGEIGVVVSQKRDGKVRDGIEQRKWLAFVRLKEGGEDTCLWRVRCERGMGEMVERLKEALGTPR